MTNMSDIILRLNDELSKAQSTYYWLLISILASIIWIVYLTYYNSRVFGLIITVFLNRFIKYGHINFGSFSISVLSGKVMFRDFRWITEDYSIRIKLGYTIFRWWQPLTKKDYNEDLSHSDTRLSMYLENFEFHVYNYSSNFSKLEKIFGLDESIIPPNKSTSPGRLSSKLSKSDLNKKKWEWRDLIPVIKIEINTSRIVFGNHLMPQSLLLSSREMHLTYSTKTANSEFDLFMHMVKCKADNFKVMLVPSPKYSGKADEPPRCMGEGFAIVQSNEVEFYYYQDEPGLVPQEPEYRRLANGDVTTGPSFPCWGMDVRCGKKTDFSYGPWCERQREFLWKFFFPPDYRPMAKHELPRPGQLRVIENFDFKMVMQSDVTIDLLFTKSKETQAIHMNCKPGSNVEFTVPMFLKEAGYTFTMNGTLMHVDSSTSLKFRSLVECETLQFNVSAKYLSNWNDLQEITYNFTACKATGSLIFFHKSFFADLCEDWSNKSRPDIYSFVPYIIKVNLLLKDFELITLTNQWNWIDCFGTFAENSNIAVCGETFDLTFTLPFTEFLPDTVAVKLFIRGESAEALIYLPETNTNRHMLIGLSENLNLLTRDGGVAKQNDELKKEKWFHACSKKDGWVEAVTSPMVALSLVYTYHPMPPIFSKDSAVNVEEVDAEEALLIPVKLVPLRPLRSQAPQKKKKNTSPTVKFEVEDEESFDPLNMDPDVVSVEIEVGSSVIYAYGSLVRNFLHLKENYFGEYQKFSDFEKNIDISGTTSVNVEPSNTPVGPFDCRMYRPFGVIFHLTLHDVQGHLVKNCSKDGEPCPCVFFERMVFELDKRYHETKLQVYFSPILVVCKDKFKRPKPHKHIESGNLTLSALQIRGHAMFSHQGLPLSSETLEYAWLIEMTIGDLVGRLTASQLQSFVEFLQTFVCMVEDKENELVCPNPYPLCQHMTPQNTCTRAGSNLVQPCPTVSDLKYEFLRISVDCIDVYLVESGSALCLQIYPIRLSKCSLFNQKTMSGVTILLPQFILKHFVLSESLDTDKTKEGNQWLESGGLNFGPLNIDLSKALSSVPLLYAQQEFLRLHDQRFQRLHFLWNSDRCGCVGGCKFFGNNRNGPTFFEPSPDDFSKSYNVAVPYLCSLAEKGNNLGFGESLLRENQYIFSQPPFSAAKYFHEIFKTKHENDYAQVDFDARLDGENIRLDTEVSSRVPGSCDDVSEKMVSKESRDSYGSRDVKYTGDSKSDLRSRITISDKLSIEIDPDDLGRIEAVSALPNETVSESSRNNLSSFKRSRGLRGSHTSAIDFPTQRRSKLTNLSKLSSLIDKFRPSRRFSLSNNPFQKWQSEKELSSVKKNSSSMLGSLSLSKEKLTSSKGSVYENAFQSLEETLPSDNDSFVSAISSSPGNCGLETFSVPVIPVGTVDTVFFSGTALPKLEALDLSETVRPPSTFLPPKPPSYLEIQTSVSQSALSSTLLMECYKCYLSQLHCSNWSSSAPVSSLNRGLRPQEDFSPYSSQYCINEKCEQFDNFVPNFTYFSRGFDSMTKVSKRSRGTSEDSSQRLEEQSLRNCVGHFFRRHTSDTLTFDFSSACEKSEIQVNDWIVVIKLKDSLNVMMSPLMLEALQRYIDSTTPSLRQMHPSSIVDMLHMKCLDSVNEQGDKNTSPSCFSVLSDPTSTTTNIEKLQLNKFHVLLQIPQINVCMLQVCLIENKVLASNLDKARDLTSASLFVACIDSLEVQMLSKAEIKSTSTLLMSNAVTPKNKKSPSQDLPEVHNVIISNLGNKIGVGKKKAQDPSRFHKMLGNTNNTIVKCKTFSEVRKENFVIQMHMSKMHFQLRRSRSLSGNLADPLSLTAIPVSLSKVFFAFNPSEKDNPGGSTPSTHYSWILYKNKKYHNAENSRSKKFNTSRSNGNHPVFEDSTDNSIDGVIGLLMFECGLENISFSSVSRFGFSEKESNNTMSSNNNDETANDVTEATKTLSSPDVNIEDSILHPGTSKNASCFCAPRTFPKTSKVDKNVDKSVETGAKTKPDIEMRAARHSEQSNMDSGPAEDKTDSTVPDRHPDDKETPDEELKCEDNKLKGDASSFNLEIKTVWFNFAAPPASSKELKYLADRQDWNLLSTATPSINAWMTPCHKIISSAKVMYDEFNKRMCSVMACIMTDALELQGIHLMKKSKYNKTSWESKFLQDDPSCQLLTVMRKYIHMVGVDVIESSLSEDTLPQVLTIKNGLLVLTKQWKNVLYLPMFDENSFKAKKKVTVTFAVPIYQSSETQKESKLNVGSHAIQVDEMEVNLDNMDVIDESTSLLKAEGGSVQKVRSNDDSERKRQRRHLAPGDETVSNHLNDSTSPVRKLFMTNDMSNLTLNSGCSSDRVIPVIVNSGESDLPYRLQKHQQQSAAGVLFLPGSKTKSQQKEDLHKWMTKQQEYLNNHNVKTKRQDPLLQSHSAQQMTSGISSSKFQENLGTTESNKEGSVAMHKVLASPTFQLVDAQVLFKPLLKAMGLHLKAVHMSAVMKKFGGELSLLANLKEVRVEIVDSESTFKSKLLKKRPCVKLSLRNRPAFLCKSFSVTLFMKDVVDFESSTACKKMKVVDMGDNSADHELVYLKTVQLFKDTIEQIEAKPATTKVNFTVTSQSVTQHVNMSLLRLVHQFVTMVESVARTKSDLKKDSPNTFSTPPSLNASTFNDPTSGVKSDFVPSMESSSTLPKRTPNSARRPKDINLPSKPLSVKELDDLEKGISGSFGAIAKDIMPSPLKLFKVDGEPVVIEAVDTSSPTVHRKTIADEFTANTPKCWKDLYHLLNLYNSMPDVMKTFTRSQLSVIEEDERNSTSKLKKKRQPSVRPKPMQSSFFTQNILVRERIPLIAFGTIHVKSFGISAVLSGLKLHAELQNCQASFSHREKIKGIAKKKSTESSASVSVNQTTVTLLEGTHSTVQQTVVQVKISRSNGMFSSFLKKTSDNSFCILHIGLVSINIPQHPVALHSMVVHSSKRLSDTLQEFIKVPTKNKSSDTLDTPFPRDAATSNGTNFAQSTYSTSTMPGPTSAGMAMPSDLLSSLNTPIDRLVLPKQVKKVRTKPIAIHFRAKLKGLIVGASLLPSLKAQYQMGEVTSSGVAGSKSKFTIDILTHSLSFSSRVNAPSNVPTSASIALSPINIQAEYRLEQHQQPPTQEEWNPSDHNMLNEGLTLRQGSYLKAVAEVGAFEHVLTTDLLNHLVFVQKVFMKEVNEVVQKVSGSDQPVTFWSDNLSVSSSDPSKPLLYSFLFRLKSLQITATTPTNNAVRLETGKIEFELSNRVQRLENSNSSSSKEFLSGQEYKIPKVFFQVKVDLNLGLGTLIKNPMFEEAEAEFPHLASFATSITLRNALQDEIISGASMDQEALLITLKRPIIFVLPSAFDKAILVWLNYRNAYEYWTEQRMALNKEIQMATQQVLTKIPPLSMAESSLGVLFLQMTIDDLGICLPTNLYTQKGFAVRGEESGLSGALVLTLENAQISACSYGSFVCKGKFTGFCLRFAEDFEVSWDDWKPEKSYEFVINAVVVPNGTFEMCSRTINLRQAAEATVQQNQQQTEQSTSDFVTTNAKWFLNILWQMKGIDIHLDANIGKRLNNVWNTLTSLAGESQMDEFQSINSQDIPTKVEQTSRKQSTIMQDDLPDFVYDLTLDSKTRTRLIENEMNEQAKVVQDLKVLRASRNTIEEEERKLQGLQAALFNDFRQDIMKRFRYHSISKKIPGDSSRFSNVTVSDHKHSRSTSLAGIKLQGAMGSLDSQSKKDSEPHRVLDAAMNSSHLRTHSFDVSQLQAVVSSATCPPRGMDVHRDLSTFQEEDSPTNTSITQPIKPQQLNYQSEMIADHMFDDDVKSIEFDDEDDYEDGVDAYDSAEHEHKTDSNAKNAKNGKVPTRQMIEPSVDFELDVRAEIDSGKCVLHPKEIKTEQAELDLLFLNKRTNKGPTVSPKLVDRRRSGTKKNLDFPPQINRLAIIPNNNTVFFIPGVEVKLHYNSRTISTLDGAPHSDVSSDKSKKILGIKKANLYTWLSIQRLPEEMLISTALLDFLEQAIEPLPIEPLRKTAFKLNAVPSQINHSRESSTSSLLSSNAQPFASFPVEVVVYIRVQPSSVRFTCLPVSRVECLLRIPSLDIVFSTKKVDNHLTDTSFMKKDRQTILSMDGAQGGGLSVSVCMNDFSLYIFHPYGGGQRKASRTENISNKNLGGRSAQMIETRKDSLSLNVEFVKVNISRSRMGVLQKDYATPTKSEHAFSKLQQAPTNLVHFSLVCNIGSASFKYDMRRLHEILALPKAWYRRTLARRLFLGEEMAVFDSDSGSDDDFLDDNISQFSSESSLIVTTVEDFHGNPAKNFQTPTRPSSEKFNLDLNKSDKNLASNPSSKSQKTQLPANRPNFPANLNISPLGKTVYSWETLVLFTVNLPQLDVMVNMSNAMGNTVWTNKGLQCQGRMMIDSAGYRDVNLFAGLSSSKLEAKGGIIGGLVELQNLTAQTFVREVPGKEPEHKIKSSFHTLEMRLDYMGSTILIARISELAMQLNDEWQLQSPRKDNQNFSPVSRSMLVFVHGKLSWDKMHLMISRSTTPDLLKMVHKLEEFFSQQFVSSKRVLSTFGAGTSNTKQKDKNREDASFDSWLHEIKFHRHWQRVLENLTCCKLSIFSSLLPEKGSMVGGSMNLIGKNIALACFHGINFRSKSWALFSMDEPFIMFATEATDIDRDGQKFTHVIQNLTFQLRHNVTDMSGKRRMAIVCKLSRGHYMPPPFTSVQEWFHYAFATNDIKDLDKFPTSTKPSTETPVVESARKQATRRMAEYSHDTEIIFILPSFQMNLKTNHLQEEKLPKEDEKKPVVECSFVTEFDDHIFVAMDAEAVLFLHDLITNYVKEKDKSDRLPKSPEFEKPNLENPTKILKLDIREFDCKTWHLEPTVRLLSWAGKEIDPVGVDYILHKLGFQHARLTIPKWMQRGVMDPLDKILSLLVNRLVVALQEAR